MGKHVCPWWLGYLLACPLLRFGHNPAVLLAPYVREGMTVLEPGPGMGFFTLELARLVGSSGRVVAVDMQRKMIEALKRRAGKAGVLARLDARIVSPDSMRLHDLAGKVDFTFAFAVVHELPGAHPFFSEIALASKPAACLLISEPTGHVNSRKFEAELQAAAAAGFELASCPPIRRSRTALMRKK